MDVDRKSHPPLETAASWRNCFSKSELGGKNTTYKVDVNLAFEGRLDSDHMRPFNELLWRDPEQGHSSALTHPVSGRHT